MNLELLILRHYEMKSIVKFNQDKHSPMRSQTNGLLNTEIIFPNKFNKDVKRNSSAKSENKLNYDEESYLRNNDITSFRHKTQLAEDFVAKKVKKLDLKNKVVSSTSFYAEIANETLTEEEKKKTQNKETNETFTENSLASDDFYKNIFENLKSKKTNECKITSLKNYYTKVRYLNRKHSEQRKSDSKMARKIVNTLGLKNTEEVYESNLAKMNNYAEKIHQEALQQQYQHNQQHQLQDSYSIDNEDSFFHASQKELINDEIKLIESSGFEFNNDDENDEEYEEDEIDENENEIEKSTGIIFDPDQYYYNVNYYNQNDNNDTTTSNDNPQNTANSVLKPIRNPLIDVKSIRKYFNIAATPLNLTRKETNLILTKSNTRLNLTNSKSAPDSNTNQHQSELDKEYKNNFYKEFTLYRQNEMKNALTTGTGTTAANALLNMLKTRQKTYLPPTKNRLKEERIKSKNSNSENLSVIAKSTSNLNEKSIDNENDD